MKSRGVDVEPFGSSPRLIQPVPAKLRLEIVIGIHHRILNGPNSCFFSNEPFENRPV